MIDARRMEVYTAMFDPELNTMAQVDAKVIDSGSFRHELENHRCFFFGNGAPKCGTLIDHDNALFLDGVHASAAHMVQVAWAKYEQSNFVDVAYFEPFYLKDFKATTPKNSILGEWV
jgi:tRNA threonylcarbamoyladenosine biosynthesis protein TsaB